MFGARGPTRFTCAPSASKIASKLPLNLVSWSTMRWVIGNFPSSIVIVALRACYVTHSELGLTVGFEMMTRRVPT